MTTITGERERPPEEPSGPIGRVRDQVRHLRTTAEHTFEALRRRRPSVDHLVRAVERYLDRQGALLAASVTYFAFLSFFPLVALAFALVGYISFANDEIHLYLENAIRQVLPGLASELPIEEIEDARTGAGIIGLLGLLYTGLGAMNAWRRALHTVWLKDVAQGPNFVVAKLGDLLAILAIGAALMSSVALTSGAQAATHELLGAVDLDGSAAAAGLTRTVALLIAVIGDTLIFLVLFGKLSGTTRPLRMLWRGALLAAAGFEILKTVGALLIRSTLDNPVYASFAVLVGLLVWIYFVSQWVLFAAAWTATWLPVPHGRAEAEGAAEDGTAAEGAQAEEVATGAVPERRGRGGRVGATVLGAGGLAVTGYAVWRRLRRGGSADRREPDS